MSRSVVLVSVPGLRADAVRPATMPFLHGLARSSVSSELDAVPGHAQPVALFTGKPPAETGLFTSHLHAPAASPYTWLRLVPQRNEEVVRPRHRFLPVRRIVRAVTRMASGATWPDPAWIPLSVLPYLRPVEGVESMDEPRAFGATSLFDLCRFRGIRHRLVEGRALDGEFAWPSHLVRALRGPAGQGLHVVRSLAIEQAATRFGPASDVVREEALRRLDDDLASLHAVLTTRQSRWDLVVCAEHGVAPVGRLVDLPAALAETKLRPGRDYVPLIHTTLASIWCRDAAAEARLRAALLDLSDCTLLDEAARVRAGVPESAGDLVLAAHPGAAFWRDHFHPPGPPVRGAHGYLDRALEGRGVIVAASSHHSGLPGGASTRSVLDVLPTLCEVLGIPRPPGLAGESLIAAPRAADGEQALMVRAMVSQVVPDA
jgi:hypothetical protein